MPKGPTIRLKMAFFGLKRGQKCKNWAEKGQECFFFFFSLKSALKVRRRKKLQKAKQGRKLAKSS